MNIASTWTNSGLNLTVPETGYYYINFNARAYMRANTRQTIPDGAYWKSELRNSADGAAVGTVFGAHASIELGGGYNRQ